MQLRRKKTTKKVNSDRPGKPGHYFPFNNDHIETFGSGCALLDGVLGKGWAENRIINVVGDSSTGKTLLAIEACANFVLKHGDAAKILYFEGESAFDPQYAASLGLPTEQVELISDVETVEEISATVTDHIKKKKKDKSKEKTFVVIDSIDSFSTKTEQGQDSENISTYGTEKAKALSRFFRRLTRDMAAADVTLMVVSQTRQRIGMFFGKSETRSGGKSLDFYASQILWLSEFGKLKRTVEGIESVIGIKVKAKCEKNKVAAPFKEAPITVIFNFGIDDLLTNLEFLKKLKKLDQVGMKQDFTAQVNRMRTSKKGKKEYDRLRNKTGKLALRLWKQREEKLNPQFRKYE